MGGIVSPAKRKTKMKKLLIIAASVMLAVAGQAATVGWNISTGSTTYGNYAYQFFVIGQNETASIATITALLDAGSSTDSYAFGSGALGANGTALVLASASGKTLTAGTYDAFAVIFDSATPTAGESKYVVVSGATNLHKVIADTTATVSFATGNANSIVSNPANWQTYGVPEPTSGLLMLLGMAGLALRRKRA